MATFRQHLELQWDKLHVMWVGRCISRDLLDNQVMKIMDMQLSLSKLLGETIHDDEWPGDPEDYGMSLEELEAKYGPWWEE